MTWSRAGMQVFSVDTQGEVHQGNPGDDHRTFILRGSGFYKEESHFVFVHASADRTLEQQQIIPCVNGNVDILGDEEKMTVSVSLNACREGHYNLIAWSPIIDEENLINNATVVENAFELLPRE